MLNDREEEDDDLVNEDSQNEEVSDSFHFFQSQNVYNNYTELFCNVAVAGEFSVTRGHIFSRVRPFYEQAVSNLDRSMYISPWVKVAHSSFMEG